MQIPVYYRKEMVKLNISIVAFSLTRQISSKLLALAHHNRQVRGFSLYTLKTSKMYHNLLSKGKQL